MFQKLNNLNLLKMQAHIKFRRIASIGLIICEFYIGNPVKLMIT